MLRLVFVAALVGVLGGCAASEPAGPSGACFQRGKPEILPDPARVRPNLSTGDGGRALFDAVVAGDDEGARALLGADPALAATAVPDAAYPDFNPDGQYGDLLTFAVAACDGAMVQTLLAAGLSPDGALNGQALSLALLAEDLSMAEALLAAGASPDPQKRGGVNVLRDVAAYGDPEPVRLLVRHGLDLEWTDQFGLDHLNTATAMFALEVAEVLVEAGDDPWRIDRDGGMPAQLLASDASVAETSAEAASLERLQAMTRRPGLPWPPPNMPTVRARVLAGEWPTPEMRAQGMDISPEELAAMRAKWGS